MSVSEHQKTAENANLAGRQAVERTPRQLKLLEQWLELQKQKIKDQVIVPHENATLSEHRNLLNEFLTKGVRSKCLSAQTQSPNNFDKNLIQK